MTNQDEKPRAAPEDEGPITQEEMIELFGEVMPIEAARLLFDPQNSCMTVGELRRKVREIARNRPAPSNVEAMREALDRFIDKHCSVTVEGKIAVWGSPPEEDWNALRAALAPPAPEQRDTYIIGWHTINQLLAGNEVTVEGLTLFPASDLASPAPEAEPVAWRVPFVDGWLLYANEKRAREWSGGIAQPLFASPVSARQIAAEERERCATLAEAIARDAERDATAEHLAHAEYETAWNDGACLGAERVAQAIRSLPDNTEGEP